MKQKFIKILDKYSVERSNKKSMKLINCTLRPYEVNDFLIDLGESLEYMKGEQEKLSEFNTSESPLLYEYNKKIRDIEDLVEDLNNSYEFNEQVQLSNYNNVENKQELKEFFEDVQSNFEKRSKNKFHP